MDIDCVLDRRPICFSDCSTERDGQINNKEIEDIIYNNIGGIVVDQLSSFNILRVSQ